MTHYICKGERCKTVSRGPSVCLEPGCEHRYRLLDECGCPHGDNHHQALHNESVSGSHLNRVHLGLALGFVVGLYTFLIGIFATLTGSGDALIELLKGVYVGFDKTIIGSAAGGLWAFVDGFIGGFLIASIYNFFQNKKFW